MKKYDTFGLAMKDVMFFFKKAEQVVSLQSKLWRYLHQAAGQLVVHWQLLFAFIQKLMYKD